jgi:3-methyl-2-oxobutanoate hydroxymethyltransferase
MKTMDKPITAAVVRAAKGRRKLAMLTAYDFPSATLVERAGADMILVGDSLAMVVLGRPDTLSVTVDEMIHHCRAVTAATERALVIGDMPFMSYEPSVKTALENAGRMVKEGGVRAVKLEGAGQVLPQVRAIVEAGIPVQGHIGLTPQRIHRLGGFLVQGKTAEAARELVQEARDLEKAGCFSIVLEAIPSEVATIVTESVGVPTIGIGAGPACDGQVLVFHDVLGLFERFTPRFVKRYAELGQDMESALRTYCEDVRSGAFPSEEHSFAIDPAEAARLRGDSE